MGSEVLPSEMIFEILSRTSLETLERCKAVSKSWKQMIYEPTFLPLHCTRTNSLFGYFFQNYLKDYKYASALVSNEGGAAAMKVTWPYADMRILASSDEGILYCLRDECHRKYRYYACKPGTNQWQPLPNPKLRYETAVVAVVVVESHPLRYIIVRLSERGMQYNCEIFDSKIWAWDKIECASPYGEIIYYCLLSVTIGQSVHWLTCADNVLTFDTTERRFRCFLLPETVRCSGAYTRKQLVEYEGELGFTCLLADNLEVWVAERRGRGRCCEWTRKKAADMKAVGEALQGPQPVEFCNTDVAFMRTEDGAVFYNFRNRSFSRVEVPYDLRIPQRIFRFRCDLETVDLRGGR